MQENVRVMLGCLPDDIRSGWVNVSRVPMQDQSVIVSDMGVDELEDVCKNDEAIEIVSNNILKFFKVTDAKDIIKYWLRKLSSGGVLKIIIDDLRMVCSEYTEFRMPYEHVSMLIMGDVDNEPLRNKSVWDMEALNSILCDIVSPNNISYRFEKSQVCFEVKKDEN
jgi:predicted SAM-dependent methyltransferase